VFGGKLCGTKKVLLNRNTPERNRIFPKNHPHNPPLLHPKNAETAKKNPQSSTNYSKTP
jgi:hypothetical protein